MARRPLLIKLGATGAACAAVLLLPPCDVRGQAPDDEWRSLETEHFRVTFPSGLEELGRRAASLAESAYDGLEETFLQPPEGRIELLVTDHTDLANGVARVTPSNRITVHTRPPVDGLSLGYFDDWLELVITHELAHIVHLDRTVNPLGRLARTVFGRPPTQWPLFPGLATPRWVIEGLATWYESSLTSAGRVEGTFLEMQLRTAAIEGRFEGIDQASGSSPLWPGGNRSYLYGSMFFEHLLERYGEDRLSAFADAVAGQWIPYRLDAAGRDALGVSLSDAWNAWSDELAEEYARLDEELVKNGAVTEAERLTDGARWGLYPMVSPDGETLVYTRSDGRSDMQLRRQDPPGSDSREVARTNGIATFSWMPDGRLLVSQLEFADPYRLYGDLYLMELDGSAERLTFQQRLGQPSVSPDGTWAVAVRQGDGTSGLVRVDLATGSVSDLITAREDIHWAFPRVSPDGRWIAATRWEPNAYHDIVLISADGAGEIRAVTADRAIDLAPSWSPDSRWLVWSSDRTGVMNVLGVEIDPGSGRAGSPALLTNVRTGVAFPSVDPAGRWLYFSAHHVDGWEVERVPFAPDAARPAPAPDPRFDPPSGLPETRTGVSGTVRNYSPLPTLLPTYWEPLYREPVVAPTQSAGGVTLPRRELLDFGIGAETSAFDLVGRHSYGAYAHLFTSRRKWEGGAVYSYNGLGNPVFTLRADQTWGAAGQLLAGEGVDTLHVLERERSADASVTLLSTRWRRSAALTLTGGLVWENRELLATDLQPSTQYTLGRPTSRLSEFRASLSYSSARTHSFQTGGARGFSFLLQGRTRDHLNLPDSLAGVTGSDRSFDEAISRVRAYVPLWGGGHATHVLALQLVGGVASGPGAGFGHFTVGGASGTAEDLTGLSLFGGRFVFMPVRGFGRAVRAGRYAWSSSAEYRFPLALVNRGFGAWPLHFDRVVAALFVDAGNAWEPNPLGGAIASVGAEITAEALGRFDTVLRVRTGLAVPVAGGGGPGVYVRVGLPF